MKAVVVGDLAIEVVTRLPYAFSDLRDDTLTYAPTSVVVGGTAANFAVAAADVFDEVTVVGCVGKDPFGDLLIRQLDAAGIQCSIRRDANPTGFAVYQRDRSLGSDGGIRHLVVAEPSANMAFDEADGERLVAVTTDADLVVADCYSMLNEPRRSAMLSCLGEISRRGVSIAVDIVPHDCWRRFSIDELDMFVADASAVIVEARTLLAFLGERFGVGVMAEAAIRAARIATTRWPRKVAFIRYGLGDANETMVVRPNRPIENYRTGYAETTNPRGFGDRLAARELFALLRGETGVNVR